LLLRFAPPGAALLATTAGQAFLSKPIRIIVPFRLALSTTADARLRITTDSGFGQAVVDNRPGAGSTLMSIRGEIAARWPHAVDRRVSIRSQCHALH
jgi:hypothetical protein